MITGFPITGMTTIIYTLSIIYILFDQISKFLVKLKLKKHLPFILAIFVIIFLL
jgi:hypothetical protein